MEREGGRRSAHGGNGKGNRKGEGRGNAGRGEKASWGRSHLFEEGGQVLGRFLSNALHVPLEDKEIPGFDEHTDRLEGALVGLEGGQGGTRAWVRGMEGGGEGEEGRGRGGTRTSPVTSFSLIR
jgi:hypothetical protein